MQTLFPLTPSYPAGFSYQDNFISVAEEENLVTAITGFALHPMQFQGYEAKRKVASFGYDWSFEKKELRKGKPIPAQFGWLVERVANHLNLPLESISELLVTEYPVDSVINWHRDAPPFALIAGISLLSDCVFKLRPHQKEKQTRKATVALTVKRRSLYVMQGEARSDWQHSIAPVQQVRYSITLRTLQMTH